MPVKIHGKEYKTVAERLNEVKADTDGKYNLETSIEKLEGDVVVMKATLTVVGKGVFTGHAMEDAGKGSINKTSHVENCETSAIGRCLASAGYAGSEFASADEVGQAIHQQNTPKKAKKTGAQQLKDALKFAEKCAIIDNLQELGEFKTNQRAFLVGLNDKDALEIAKKGYGQAQERLGEQESV